MKIDDQIYGPIEITDPVIIKLIKTKPFQRLQQINQYGGVNFLYPDSYQTTRFQHSIGVWYATYMLGGDLESQVAALLHDVGHFAFSHLIDVAMADSKENEHEFTPSEIAGWDEIAEILAADGLELKNVDEYKLIKNSLPDIGTDRLDYALRDLESVIPVGDNFGAKVLADIVLVDEEIVFQTLDIAREFASRGNKAMWHVIYDPKIAVIYQSLVEFLQDGLSKGWLDRQDLLSTDAHVFSKIREHVGDFDEKYVRVLSEQVEVEVVEEGQPYDFKFVKLKSRYFNPKVKLNDGSVKRVSELDPNFQQELQKYVEIFEQSKQGMYLRIKS